MNRRSVLIVDDNDSISELLLEYLGSQPHYSSVQKVTSIEVLQKKALELRTPDIVLMDIMLPGMSGIEGVEVVITLWPNAHVIMNSVLDDAEAVYQSLQAGALGYVTKDMPLDAIDDAIQIVSNGGSFMNSKIARKVVEYFQRGQIVRSLLNQKEWGIANGIKDGLSYKMIAAQHDLSIDGVRFYIQRIYRKLNINSRGELTKLLS